MREAYSADPAASRARVAARSAAHPDKLKAEKQREYARHADDYKARAQQRKLIIKQRSANLTAEHKLAINMLHARSRELTRKTGIPHEVDHIVPLCGENVSGLHVPWNLQILPRLDNRRKRNSLGNLSAREQLNDVRTQEQQPCP